MRSLLVTEGDDWIDAGGAARWEKGRGGGNSYQDDCDGQ